VIVSCCYAHAHNAKMKTVTENRSKLMLLFVLTSNTVKHNLGRLNELYLTKTHSILDKQTINQMPIL